MVGAAAAVALWMGLGFILRLSPNTYLLLGVPITVAFQLLVRGRRLHEMWVRDAAGFRLDRTGIVLAVPATAHALGSGVRNALVLQV